ncbi:ATP-dependent helicase HrpB [Paenibacillus taiwanensis]|uniref:ATP-dependent helicase HrpB n=1 Tax=Paenibacillus taiwanensis TaxID=401638 RepID=UPI0006849A72|nr:ATP-dependent helicase HrpB [Paenibacillus taiwanensis]
MERRRREQGISNAAPLQQAALPIDVVCPSIVQALASGKGAVLVAEPGAGKTTRVPLALLDAPWLNGGRIVMLEPRRLAARAASQFMAATLGERVGDQVGYRVRMDTKVSAATRIEVVTEGVLTRMLQTDPSLEGIGLLIFDEFHERNLHADLGLALALEAQSVLREDLRILVMSATLEAEPVAALMDGVPIIQSKGRTYPVETHYIPRVSQEPLETAVARQVERALHTHDGDIMVFLPGAGEIHRTAGELAKMGYGGANRAEHSITVLPLYGQLPQEAQDAAIAPGRADVRKVVLTTSIAETSLTVEGVRVVIDSGYSRVSRFSPRTGMSRLVTERVTQDAADQRRGRAGRLGPGICYRLWSAEEHGHLAKQRVPEMLDADLAPLALELAGWGSPDGQALRWLTPPPSAALQQARHLLDQLGAVSDKGKLSAHGRRMMSTGLHPRLAHMVLISMEMGYGREACEWAALLQERDIVRSGSTRSGGTLPAERIGGADIRSRLKLIRQMSTSTVNSRHNSGGGTSRLQANTQGDSDTANGSEATSYVSASNKVLVDQIDSGSLWRVQEEIRRLERTFPQIFEQSDKCKDIQGGVLLALAFPDRIAERRADGRYLLSSGRGAAFGKATAQDPIAYAPYVVAVQLDDQGTDSRIQLAAPISLEVIEAHLKAFIKRTITVEWDKEAEAVRALEQMKLGALVLRERPDAQPDADQVLAVLLDAIARHPEGLQVLPWSKSARQLQARLEFMHFHRPDEWPAASDGALLATLHEWLAPHLYGMRKRSDLQKLQLTSLLEGLLPWPMRQQLDAVAPSSIVVPSGSRIGIDYSKPEQPVLAVRLQELFGLQETPRIAGGKVPLTLHLLSPAQRPVQVTQDLASFWRSTYFEVKKDLKGRYPKHYWPEDPTEALATRRTRPPGGSA